MAKARLPGVNAPCLLLGQLRLVSSTLLVSVGDEECLGGNTSRCFRSHPQTERTTRGGKGGRPGDCEAGGAEGLSAVINRLQFSLPLSQGSRPPRFPRREHLLVTTLRACGRGLAAKR